MPFDGDLQPHDSGWTIKVEPSPSISEQSQLWSPAQRLAYHDIAAGVAFQAVTAIQNNTLRTRRERLPLPQGVARYFFRQLRNQHNTICITIFEIHFYDPNDDHDPDGGARSPRPLDPLVLNVSGAGKRYSIDYVEGVLPPPPCTNEIDRHRQAMSRFAECNTRPSVDDGVSGHSTVVYPSKNHLISCNDSLHLLAPGEGSAAKPYPRETREIIQFVAIYFVGHAPHRIVARLGEVERLAIDRDMDTDKTKIPIDIINTQNLLSSISLLNSLTPRMQQVYPSGPS